MPDRCTTNAPDWSYKCSFDCYFSGSHRITLYSSSLRKMASIGKHRFMFRNCVRYNWFRSLSNSCHKMVYREARFGSGDNDFCFRRWTADIYASNGLDNNSIQLAVCNSSRIDWWNNMWVFILFIGERLAVTT